MVGTLRQAEGGGLRSFEDNRVAAETQLRNEAGRMGGDSIAVIDEQRGDTDLGALQFSSGVTGMTTSNTGCTNCVLLTAHVFQCDGRGAPAAEVRPLPRPPSDDCARQRPALAPPPPPPPLPPLMPAPAVTVIILPPPQMFMPPQYQPPFAPFAPPAPPAPPPRYDDPE
jgi:hypothetical protein